MSNTQEYLTRVKLIHDDLTTFIDRQKSFHERRWPRPSADWATADARLDALRQTLGMVIRLQLDLEREVTHADPALENLFKKSP
jgi:hypothetical protein